MNRPITKFILLLIIILILLNNQSNEEKFTTTTSLSTKYFDKNTATTICCNNITMIEINNVGWPGYMIKCDLKSFLNSEYITIAINSFEQEYYSIKILDAKNQQKYLTSNVYTCLNNNDCNKIYKSNKWPPQIITTYHNDNLPNGMYYIYIENQNYIYPGKYILKYMFNPTEVLFNTYFTITDKWQKIYSYECGQLDNFQQYLFFEQKMGNWLIFFYNQEQKKHLVYMYLQYYDKNKLISSGNLYIHNYQSKWLFNFQYNSKQFFATNFTLSVIGNFSRCKITYSSNIQL